MIISVTSPSSRGSAPPRGLAGRCSPADGDGAGGLCTEAPFRAAHTCDAFTGVDGAASSSASRGGELTLGSSRWSCSFGRDVECGDAPGEGI